MASSAPQSATWTLDLRGRLDGLLDGYRLALHDSLDGLTDEQTRLRLVPSKTRRRRLATAPRRRR